MYKYQFVNKQDKGDHFFRVFFVKLFVFRLLNSSRNVIFLITKKYFIICCLLNIYLGFEIIFILSCFFTTYFKDYTIH